MPEFSKEFIHSKLESIKMSLANELLERATNPKDLDHEEYGRALNLLQQGGKLQLSRSVRELLIRICQDNRLLPDETDAVISEIFT